MWKMKEKGRMMEMVYSTKTECSGCGACENICPKNCITMHQDNEGFFYPEVNQDACIHCKSCVSVCPFQNVPKTAQTQACYAAVNRNDEIRMKSSSGAVFSALAQKVIEQQGVVFGSAFSDDFKQVEVVGVDELTHLERLYGSKYVQSQAHFSYKKVKSALNAGKMVLFSGTPCQVSGLKSYLGKNYENLYCVDIICHGVPSPELWKKYAEYIETKYNGKISAVNFRCKDQGWKDFGLKERVKEKELFSSKNENPYMHMFLRNYCLRPSCYQCKIKGRSAADITIGDFWGIKTVYPDMDDGKGVSAVLIRNERGQALFNRLKNSVDYCSCRYEDIVKNNSGELYSVPFPKERNTFFSDMNRFDFEKLSNHYMEPSLKRKIKKFIKKFRGAM